MASAIEFNWDIHYKCNYRCPYCFSYGNWQNLSRCNKYFSMEQWVDSWHRIYERYGSVRIKIASGEPFIYPHFFDLIKQLIKEHTFNIITNLSCGKEQLIDFIEDIPPHRLFLDASFHPLFTSFEEFLEKALIVKEKGFLSCINYVAYPPELGRMEYFKKRFKNSGLNFSILPFRGRYNNIIYPGGYTDREKVMIYNLSGDLPLGQRENLRQMMDLDTTKGKLCNAGYKYARIDSDGIVYRCGQTKNNILGNFFDKNFSLLSHPLPCESENCPCEFQWLVKEEDNNKECIASHKYSDRIAKAKEMQSDSSHRLPPPYQIFFTWDIHYKCNYSCPYCFFADIWNVVSKENRYPGFSRWLKIWRDIFDRYGNCNIHITGGEPCIYPDFIELIMGLSKYHSIEIDTNLSFDVKNFITRIKPDNIKFTATFHPLFVDLSSYLCKASLLKDNGFDIYVDYVAYPPQLREMERYKLEFKKRDISFKILAFRGKFQGKLYPKNYTEEEEAIIKRCGDSTTEMIFDAHVGAKKQREIKLCRMGQMYAKIRADGSAYRCCCKVRDNKGLGNMLEGTFKLLEDAYLCKDECICWKAMIVGEEENWLKFWSSGK